MVDLDQSSKTEPPLLMHLSDEIIASAADTPLIIPNYECHIYDVERSVALVTESAQQRVGIVNRHRYYHYHYHDYHYYYHDNCHI